MFLMTPLWLISFDSAAEKNRLLMQVHIYYQSHHFATTGIPPLEI